MLETAEFSLKSIPALLLGFVCMDGFTELSGNIPRGRNRIVFSIDEYYGLKTILLRRTLQDE